MIYRPGSAWTCLVFDLDGKLYERSIRTGAPRLIVDEIHQAADHGVRRFELGGLVMGQPSYFSPDELAAAVRDALAIKLPANFASILPDNIIAQQWCRKD